MKLDILNIEGENTGRQIDLPESVFGVEPSEHALYLAVKQYLANQRQGTHKTKERNEIVGSTRKVKRQKGTGTARMGSLKNPILRGGGRTFGPKPRKYQIKLNKKQKKLARLSALSTKANNGQIMVVEDFTFDQPRTSAFVGVLQNLKVDGEKTILVTSDYDKNLYLSSRNLQKSRVMNAKDLSTYGILIAHKLILSESAVVTIKESFA